MEGTDGKERISIYVYIYILFTHVYMYMISLADFSISCWLLTPSARHGVRLDWFSFGWFVVEVQCLSRCSGDFCYSLLATYTHTHTHYIYIYVLPSFIDSTYPLTCWYLQVQMPDNIHPLSFITQTDIFEADVAALWPRDRYTLVWQRDKD